MNNQPLVQTNMQATQAAAAQALMDKKDNSTMKTVLIVILSLVSVTFIGLFIWTLIRYNDVNDDVASRISAAVIEAKEEQALADEALFAEREKEPYLTFSGPEDYGQLTFEYPKTWSVYIASDASSGGDFEAYMNPIEVEKVSNTTVNALRVSILNKDFESVISGYQRYVGSSLNVDVITVGGVSANRYSGTIPGTDLNGYIVVFKIRDKTVVLRADSVLFADDFDRILSTIRFNA